MAAHFTSLRERGGISPLIVGVLVTLLCAVAPWLWLPANAVIAGIDTPPLVDYSVQTLTTLHTWDPVPNGGISNFVGYGMYWPYLLVGSLFQRMGATPHDITTGAMSAAFALGALGMFLLGRRCGTLVAAALAFAFTFNLAHTFLAPAIGTMLAYAMLPWFPLAALKATELSRRAQVALGITCGILTTGLIFAKINPPTYVTMFLGGGLLSCILLASEKRKPPLPFLAAFACTFVGVNAWWIMDFLLSLKLDRGAVTAPLDITWVSASSTLAQVLLLGGSWAFAPQFDSAPFFAYSHWMRLPLVQVCLAMAPLGAILLALTFNRTRGALLIVIAIVILAIANAGFHQPFVDAYAWFFNHIPGAWLYREPLSKFDGVLLAVYLIAFVAIMPQLTLSRDKALASGFLGLTILGAIVGGAPLLNGTVIRPQIGSLPSFKVVVPKYWHSFAQWANEQGGGRIAVFPQNQHYQVLYSWGYFGADINGNLLRHPFIDVTPTSSYTDSPLKALEMDWYADLDGPSYDARQGKQLADALNVQYVIVRHDVRPSPVSPILTPESVYLPRLLKMGFSYVRSFGAVDVYERACCRDVRQAVVEPANMFVSDKPIAPLGISLSGWLNTVAKRDLGAQTPSHFERSDAIAVPGKDFVFGLLGRVQRGVADVIPYGALSSHEAFNDGVRIAPGEEAIVAIGNDLEPVLNARPVDWTSSPGATSALGELMTARPLFSTSLRSAQMTIAPVRSRQQGAGLVLVRAPKAAVPMVIEVGVLDTHGKLIQASSTVVQSSIHPTAVFRYDLSLRLQIRVLTPSGHARPTLLQIRRDRIDVDQQFTLQMTAEPFSKTSTLVSRSNRLRLDPSGVARFHIAMPLLATVAIKGKSAAQYRHIHLELLRYVDGIEMNLGSGAPLILALQPGDYGIAVRATSGHRKIVRGVSLVLTTSGANVTSVREYPSAFSSLTTLSSSETGSTGTYLAKTRSFVLLPEASSNGWQLMVDGHEVHRFSTLSSQNGWLVPAGSHTFALSFYPERVAGALQWVALGCCVLAIAIVLIIGVTGIRLRAIVPVVKEPV